MAGARRGDTIAARAQACHLPAPSSPSRRLASPLTRLPRSAQSWSSRRGRSPAAAAAAPDDDCADARHRPTQPDETAADELAQSNAIGEPSGVCVASPRVSRLVPAGHVPRRRSSPPPSADRPIHRERQQLEDAQMASRAATVSLGCAFRSIFANLADRVESNASLFGCSRSPLRSRAKGVHPHTEPSNCPAHIP